MAISDCHVLIEGPTKPIQTRSAANGAVYADISHGDYLFVLNKEGLQVNASQ